MQRTETSMKYPFPQLIKSKEPLALRTSLTKQTKMFSALQLVHIFCLLQRTMLVLRSIQFLILKITHKFSRSLHSVQPFAATFCSKLSKLNHTLNTNDCFILQWLFKKMNLDSSI